jgi:hypothetical protein
MRKRESRSSRALAGHKRRIQTRGGGRGGLSDVGRTVWITRTDRSNTRGVGITDAGVSTADRPKQFGAQPATDPQLPGPFWSQGWPCAQQSDGVAVREAPAALATATTPATGSSATDIAMRAIKMARKVFMACFRTNWTSLSRSSDGIVSGAGALMKSEPASERGHELL